MSDLIIREIEAGDEDQVIALWQACALTRPWNDPATDLAFARDKSSSQILVAFAPTAAASPRLIASAMVGHDGHRGSMYYVAVHPDERGKAYGRAIMHAAETWLADRGVWAVRLMIRSSNQATLEFYDKLGYSASDVVITGKTITPNPNALKVEAFRATSLKSTSLKKAKPD